MTRFYKTLLFIIFIINVPATMEAQNWQTVLSVDSRIGYSSNTYLNPFFSAWDPSTESGYSLISLFGQTFWSRNSNMLNITGGVIAEPFFNNKKLQKGGLGLIDYRKILSPSFNIGIESGSSYFSGLKKNSMIWGQPYLTWLASSNISMRLKGGSYFQYYKSKIDSLYLKHRSDVLGIDFEAWPSYHWQIESTFYSNLDKLKTPQDQLKTTFSVGYSFLNGTNITARLGFQQFKFQSNIQSEQGGTSNNSSTSITYGRDKIWQIGLTGNYLLNKSFSLFTTVQYLRRNISPDAEPTNDLKISAGIRFVFQPHFGRKKDNIIKPEWKQKNDHTMLLTIKYSGNGRLYLVGDFNNWKKAGLPLIEKSKNTYQTQVVVSTGSYEYKILHVEGSTEEWLPFSKDTYTVDDGFGNKNTVLLVQ